MATLSSDASPAAGSGDTISLPAGYTVRRYATVDSTSDEAKRLADQGAPDRTLVVAEEQVGGRGRYGRSWASPRGNLYTSIVFRPDVAPGDAAKIGYVASVVVAEVVTRLAGTDTGIVCKWPNDVLVHDKKIAGILPEASIDAGGAVDWVVLGIGLNIVSNPSDTRWPSTSLQEQGARNVSLDMVLAALCEALDVWCERWLQAGFDQIRDAWLKRAWSIGREIRTVLPERTLTGRFLGIDEAGALILGTDDGRREKIHYGEIFPVEAR